MTNKKRPDGRPVGNPFVKGRSGNPTGRPSTRTEEVRRAISPMLEEALAALHEAIRRGESWAVTLWCHYTYGKPIDAVAPSDGGSSGLTVVVRKYLVKADAPAE